MNNLEPSTPNPSPVSNDRYDPNLILDYVEGEIDAARRARLEAMLAEDASLRELVEQLVADRAAVRALPREQPTGDLTEPSMGLLERRLLMGEEPVVARVGPAGVSSPGVSSPRRGVWGRLAVGLSLAAALGLAGGVVWLTTQDGPLMQRAERLAKSGAVAEASRELARVEPAETSELAIKQADEAFAMTVPPASAVTPPALPQGLPTVALDLESSRVESLGAASALPGGGLAAANEPVSLAARQAEVGSSPAASAPAQRFLRGLDEPAGLVIRSRTPARTQQQVRDWAIANALPVKDAAPEAAVKGESVFLDTDGRPQREADADLPPVTYVYATPGQIASLQQQLNQPPMQPAPSVATLAKAVTSVGPSRDDLLRERRLGELHQVAPVAPLADAAAAAPAKSPEAPEAPEALAVDLNDARPPLAVITRPAPPLHVYWHDMGWLNPIDPPQWVPIHIVPERIEADGQPAEPTP